MDDPERGDPKTGRGRVGSKIHLHHWVKHWAAPKLDPARLNVLMGLLSAQAQNAAASDPRKKTKKIMDNHFFA